MNIIKSLEKYKSIMVCNILPSTLSIIVYMIIDGFYFDLCKYGNEKTLYMKIEPEFRRKRKDIKIFKWLSSELTFRNIRREFGGFYDKTEAVNRIIDIITINSPIEKYNLK